MTILQPETKKCQNCQKKFTVEPEDFEFYEKMSDKNSEIKVPAPTWCPECRTQRRMGFYNVQTLYTRKCDKCQKNIMAIYLENTDFPVYCSKCWWSDDWEATNYAQEYDFQKTFYEQFLNLQKKVPRVALEVDYSRNINSPYANDCGPLKDCYLVFLASDCENVMYSSEIDNSKDTLDCSNVSECENCYNLFNCDHCYNTFNSVKCGSCVDVNYSRNLRNCSNCFGCVNLKNAQYYIFNKKYSREDYFDMLEKFNLNSYDSSNVISKKCYEFSLQKPFKHMNGVKNENVSGESIFFSKNVKDSFLVIEGENIKNSQMLGLGPTKDCQDYTSWGENAEMIYESVHSGGGINNIKFTNGAWQSFGIDYGDNIFFSNNLFGCIFMNKKQYCILNKQYSKEEYFKMVEKIKKQMNEMPYTDQQGGEYKYGEFFPPELSPFAYNETIAQEYFPLTKEEAKKQGYRWRDREKRNYEITLKNKDIPDDIKDVDNSILKEVIECATLKNERESTNCTEAFKIVPQELEFYKKMNLPLPRYCPNCRHHQRLKHRNPLKLYKRTCMKEGCSNEFETTYAPDRPEIVYCEKCYQEEVV